MKLTINNSKLFFCLPSSFSVLIQQRASRDDKHRIAQLLVGITAHIPFANVYIPYQNYPEVRATRTIQVYIHLSKNASELAKHWYITFFQ